MATKKKSSRKPTQSSAKSKSIQVTSKKMSDNKKAKSSPKKAASKQVTQKTSKKVPLQRTSTKSVSGKKKVPTPTFSKNAVVPRTTASKKPLRPAGKTSGPTLEDFSFSAQDRYHVGGLCACVIDTSTISGEEKLRRVLTFLQLSEKDQGNLYRVSQGVKIPKLFTDQFRSEDFRQTIWATLRQFAKADEASDKQWSVELAEWERLLGV